MFQRCISRCDLGLFVVILTLAPVRKTQRRLNTIYDFVHGSDNPHLPTELASELHSAHIMLKYANTPMAFRNWTEMDHFFPRNITVTNISGQILGMCFLLCQTTRDKVKLLIEFVPFCLQLRQNLDSTKHIPGYRY